MGGAHPPDLPIEAVTPVTLTAAQLTRFAPCCGVPVLIDPGACDYLCECGIEYDLSISVSLPESDYKIRWDERLARKG